MSDTVNTSDETRGIATIEITMDDAKCTPRVHTVFGQVAWLVYNHSASPVNVGIGLHPPLSIDWVTPNGNETGDIKPGGAKVIVGKGAKPHGRHKYDVLRNGLVAIDPEIDIG